MSAETALDLSLTEAAAAVAAGEVSSEALTRAALARMESLGTALNCVARLDREEALEAAARADRARKEGRSLGPLHGIPLAHKDLFYRAGKPSTGGSKIRRDFVPEVTATVLRKLDDAGQVDLGALQLAEFALSPTGYNIHYGQARNPWDPERVTGGSSSGSGAAVAARMVFGSLGSDTAGSIRLPAAMCGVTGLKPTTTRVSRAGAMPLSNSLDTVGPLARTARDCARLMEVIAGEDPADPTAARRAVPRYESLLEGNARGLRIGVPRPGSYYDEHLAPEVRACLDESLRALREAGAQVVEVDLPDLPRLNACLMVVMAAESAAIHRPWLETRPQDYSEQIRRRIEPGLSIPAVRYLESMRLRAPLAREFVAMALNAVDALHLPAVPIPVPTIEETVQGDAMETITLIGRCTRAINYLGLPAASVPCGFDPRGLPVGFQLVGRPFAEGRLLRVADAYQRLTSWHRQKPGQSRFSDTVKP